MTDGMLAREALERKEKLGVSGRGGEAAAGVVGGVPGALPRDAGERGATASG